MDRSVTVSIKGALVALVVALALTVAYLLGSGGGTAQASPSAAPTTGSTHPRTVVTTGTGDTVGVPDELAFTVSIGVVRPTLDEAMSAGNDLMGRLLATLDRLGVRRSDVQSTGLQMNAVYDYHAYSPPTLRGYRVSQRAQVLVRDLTKGGRAVSAVVHAGGNEVRVSGLGLRISDPDSLLAKSRAAAVKEATAKAQEYADATGQTLGPVLSLREVHASAVTPRPVAFQRTAAFDAVKALPIRAGKDRLGVTVRIVWSFA
jgi:uncharacterized protein YggE